MAQETFLFTSESVNEGHPDKLCDQVGGCNLVGVAEALWRRSGPHAERVSVSSVIGTRWDCRCVL
jgi:S-adenosylmethionine synthetase